MLGKKWCWGFLYNILPKLSAPLSELRKVPKDSTKREDANVIPSFTRCLKQVDHKDHLCDNGRLLATIHMLTKRLVLKKTGTGAWELRLERKLERWLFGGLWPKDGNLTGHFRDKLLFRGNYGILKDSPHTLEHTIDGPRTTTCVIHMVAVRSEVHMLELVEQPIYEKRIMHHLDPNPNPTLWSTKFRYFLHAFHIVHGAQNALWVRRQYSTWSYLSYGRDRAKNLLCIRPIPYSDGSM